MYVELFILGLSLGAGPCMAVCAPILLPFIASTKMGWYAGLKSTIVFSLSRAFAYSLLAVIAVLGYGFVDDSIAPQNKSYLSMFTGSFVVLCGILFIFMKKDIHLPLFKKLTDLLLRKSGHSMAVLGLLIGLSPCLPLIGALALIAGKADSPLHGALLGLSFGMGTFLSPLLVLGLLAGSISKRVSRNQKIFATFRMICGILLVAFGLYLVKG